MSEKPFTIKKGEFYRLYTESTNISKRHADFIIHVIGENGSFITATILTVPPDKDVLNVNLQHQVGVPGKPDEFTILFSANDCYLLAPSEKTLDGEVLQIREISRGKGLVSSDLQEEIDALKERQVALTKESDEISKELQRLSTHKVKFGGED